MQNFKSIKGKGMPYIIMETLLYNGFIVLLLFFINSYELSNLIKVALIVINIYEFHYIFMYMSLKYSIDDKYIYIYNIFGLKEEKISLKEIKGYNKSQGRIKGIKLYGYGKDNFALGKSIIDNIGTTKMYITSNSNIFYLKTEDMVYGLSPENAGEFEEILKNKEIQLKKWEYKFNKNTNFYKDKKFIIPFGIVTLIIIYLTLTPFVLYLYGKLPEQMPLSFNANFEPVKMGTGKQFAFKQMTYGVLNMAILLCMYYSSYFYSKYDKKSAYKFIYVSLIVALLFFIIQGRILVTF
ncbi:PH domain-containing protein [Clostridium rectalis]|uniref:PH domain-containing protein n=1 Tax=Clostridium rectalis TaxID=2040295 RepID=UPI000F640572|nr:PH domain-containing protein [Clostridium rectalis]